MSEVSLEAESETITKDPQMDYKEDHKTEDSLRSDLDDENEGSYESVDLDKDHYHTDAHRLEGGFEEMDQQLDADVQGVGTGVHSDTDDHSSGDDVIMKGSADEGELHGTHHHTNTSETPEANGESCSSQTQGTTMAEDSHRSSAAEIPVTSNGDVDQSSEKDSSPGPPSGLNLSESSSSYTSTTEGIVESGPYRGQQRSSGAVVVSDDLKNPAMEKLDLVRKWSITTYKCTRQILSEKLGRGSKTVDLELENQIEVLRDNKRRYEHVVKLAQTLSTQLAQMMHTQKQLGDAFADLSLKSPELHEEFGYNAETQRLLAKNAETLLSAINFFITSVNTLVDKTIEDTMINIKQYEAARIEYDAYRTDLEELNLGPRDASTMPKIEVSQRQFQAHREKYERMRNDVAIKLKFLEENKVKVLHNQLMLFHNAIAAYYAGNQQKLEQTLKQFHIKLKMPGGDTPSWLERN